MMESQDETTDFELACLAGSKVDIAFMGLIMVLRGALAVAILTFQCLFLFSKVAFALCKGLVRGVHAALDGVDNLYGLIVRILSRIYRVVFLTLFIIVCYTILDMFFR